MSGIKLRPMKDAPKDREIFAVYLRRDHYGNPIPGALDYGNIHPLQWKDYPWQAGHVAHWGMRWSKDFRTSLDDYGGWFDPKDIEQP